MLGRGNHVFFFNPKDALFVSPMKAPMEWKSAEVVSRLGVNSSTSVMDVSKGSNVAISKDQAYKTHLS